MANSTTQNRRFDAVVIGGGPAGISAAFWCAELGLSVAIIEREPELGGQLLWTFGPIGNYLGLRAQNGRELRNIFVDHIGSQMVTRFTGIGVESADLSSRSVLLSDGRRLSAQAVILATGVRRRKLGIPGEEEFVGKGILQSGQNARGTVSGKRVIIIGGGDAALENALILSETAERVTVVHRRDQFSARGEFVAGSSARANVEFHFNSTATAILGDERVEAVEVLTAAGGPERIDCDHVLIRVGVEPNVGPFRNEIALNDRGYVIVNADCSTGVDGIYAIGDVASPLSPTIATAVGMGATAAKAITALIEKDQA